jgi:hypothetical protein
MLGSWLLPQQLSRATAPKLLTLIAGKKVVLESGLGNVGVSELDCLREDAVSRYFLGSGLSSSWTPK